jgi:hypothetical protein
MKTTLVFASIFTLFTITSCGEKDSICDCIDASNKLNEAASKVLVKEATAKDEKTLKTLRTEKKKKCAEFENMSGTEMMERKESCGE